MSKKENECLINILDSECANLCVERFEGKIRINVEADKDFIVTKPNAKKIIKALAKEFDIDLWDFAGDEL
jgi:hypothetical protein